MLSRRKLLKASSFLAMPSLILRPAKAQWSSCGAGFCNNAPPQPNPTWAKVQSKLNTSPASVSTWNTSFPTTVGSGNIVVGGMISTSAILVSVTDDKGNAYSIVNSDGILNGNLQVTGFRSTAPLTNSPQTLTFTATGNVGLVWQTQDEFTAGFPLTNISLDGSQLVVNGSVTTTEPFQTLQSNTLQYAACFTTGAATAGAGWTAAQGSGGQQFSEWKKNTSPSGSTVALFGNTGSVWVTTFAISATAPSTWVQRQNQIQRSATSVPNGGTASISFLQPMASGSIGIGAIALGVSPPENDMSFLTSLVDDKGNTWSVLGPGVGTGNGRAVIWSGGALTNGPTTVTATVSHTESILFFLINEFIPPPGTSVFAVDQFSYVVPGGGPPYPTDTITTTHNNDLIYSFFDTGAGGNQPVDGLSTSNGYGQTWCDGYRIQQTAGAAVQNWTAGGSPLDQAIVGFKAS